ncbi:MAG: MGMT family protein [Beijerinckiaceae bacterium]|nr:MGMT family protein [Beijerinckiaceae bacterium]MCZ8299431.1 MGMT family protein [Beijerinckiaceae bacterium]
MAGSPFFVRIKTDVLAIVAAIPPDRVTTFAQIGRHLDVMPRHVAYILARLDPVEFDIYPWFRVIGQVGDIGIPKANHRGESQRQLLASEGHMFDAAGCLIGWAGAEIAIEALTCGVPQQKRPADAPAASRRSRAKLA